MKKVIGILALLVFAGNIASAELLENFKYDGEIEVNSMVTNNGSDLDSDSKDKLSDTESRVLLNMSFDLAEDAGAVISAAKNSRQYGAAGETAVNGALDAFVVEQAYVHLKGVLGLDHKIGRQYYGDKGSIVVYAGPLTGPFAPSASANAMSAVGIDGYSAWYNSDLLNLHFVTFKNSEIDIAGGDRDMNTNGIAGTYNLGETLGLGDFLSVGAYVYERKQMENGTTPNTTLDVVGVKGNGKIEALGLSYYGEMAKNYGRKSAAENYTGNAILLGAAMDVELAGKWTFSAEMARGSGEDDATDDEEAEFTALNTDYIPGIVWGGAAGKTGITNTTTWNIGAKWNTPMFEKLTLGAKLYHFGYTEDVTAGGQTTDTIGNELDLCVNWQHNENVGIKAYYGALMPTSKWAKYNAASATAENDAITVMGAALTVKFGNND